MIRRALLIGVGVTRGESNLPGTYMDIQALCDYLISIAGGAWERSEVEVLRDPSRAQVRQAMSWIAGADFSFVSFSGHGCEREVELYPGIRVPMTHMVCSDGLQVRRTELTPSHGRSVVLLDCCRVFHRTATRVDDVVGALNYAEGRISRTAARLMFERAVEEAQLGPEFVYGCEFNGAASDLPSFTSSLVASSVNWARRGAGVLDLARAFELAKSVHGAVSPGYNPTLDLGRGSLHRPVPFAVGENLVRPW